METLYYDFIYELIRFNPIISDRSIVNKLFNYLQEIKEEYLPDGFDPLEDYRIQEIDDIRNDCAAIE